MLMLASTTPSSPSHFDEALEIEKISTPRPMTHDLMGDIVSVLGGRIFAVEIQSLVGSTYYGAIRLVSPSGEVTVSARPSDAIALALRVGAPILIALARRSSRISITHSCCR